MCQEQSRLPLITEWKDQHQKVKKAERNLFRKATDVQVMRKKEEPKGSPSVIDEIFS